MFEHLLYPVKLKKNNDADQTLHRLILMFVLQIQMKPCFPLMHFTFLSNETRIVRESDYSLAAVLFM